MCAPETDIMYVNYTSVLKRKHGNHEGTTIYNLEALCIGSAPMSGFSTLHSLRNAQKSSL